MYLFIFLHSLNKLENVLFMNYLNEDIFYRFEPRVIRQELIEYLGGVDPRLGCLPLLHDLRAHHVELLLLMVQAVVQVTQLRAVLAHRKVLMEDKKDN